MKAIIIIEVEGTPKAIERLSDQVSDLIVDATMAGGITSLTSDELRGREVTKLQAALEKATAKQ